MNGRNPMRTAGAALLVLLAVACAGPSEDARAAYEPTVLGHLVLRDHTVTLWLAEDESLYTIADEDGTVLADRVDESYLAVEFPELFNALKGSLAEEGILWAGEDPQVEGDLDLRRGR
jgi:hypothetical protein